MPIVYYAVSKGARYGGRAIAVAFETAVECLILVEVGCVLGHVLHQSVSVLPVGNYVKVRQNSCEQWRTKTTDCVILNQLQVGHSQTQSDEVGHSQIISDYIRPESGH